MSCVNLWKSCCITCNALTAMRGAWICLVDENGHLNSANFRLQWRSTQFFKKRFSSQTIEKLLVVNLLFPCAIMTSWMLSRWLSLDLWWFSGWLCVLRWGIRRKYRGDIILIIGLLPCSRLSWISVGTVEDSPGHCLPLWCKADCQTQRLQFVHLIQILVPVHWRNIAKYIGLENTTLQHCSWRVRQGCTVIPHI